MFFGQDICTGQTLLNPNITARLSVLQSNDGFYQSG
ncbi:hypothetical protein B6N60_03273 [Richelia sinica FACHB-800]|uniref:Uncharacterized protein n=1 Tax=Richelia sinica FACHB-800 TaxID=1357546 RepID=A0A975Y5T8_9NOST|nr:hypothetical protein B6N60_03273 [Richelia sinica FACHB-800]